MQGTAKLIDKFKYSFFFISKISCRKFFLKLLSTIKEKKILNKNKN